jgi:DNA polymerase elongation subunit (family B)
MRVLNILSKESNPEKLTEYLPEILGVLRERLNAFKEGLVPLEELVITQRLSREPEKFSVLSSSAIVARQLQSCGKKVKRGQRIRFIYTAPAPGVWAWDLPTLPNPKTMDRVKYRELLIRAVHEVLQPLGVTEVILKNWLIGEAGYLAPPGFLKTANSTRLALPLLAELRYLRVD